MNPRGQADYLMGGVDKVKASIFGGGTSPVRRLEDLIVAFDRVHGDLGHELDATRQFHPRDALGPARSRAEVIEDLLERTRQAERLTMAAAADAIGLRDLVEDARAAYVAVLKLRLRLEGEQRDCALRSAARRYGPGSMQ